MDMIYLKNINGTVEAYGDMESAEFGYDKVVSASKWEECGCHAYASVGRIVLGWPTEELAEMQSETIRTERAERLKACDLISPMRWNAMTETQKQAWTDYRQALLDIPQQEGFPWGGDPDAVPWPVKPE